VLALILAVALGARLWLAHSTHLWFDELYTLWIARLPFADLLRAVAGDVHPPLHYALEWAWRRLGGDGDLWIKSLSVVTGLANVALMYVLGRDLFGRREGVLAAALLAVHPAHVAFSQEGRSYALLFLALTFATWRGWRWLGGALAALLFAPQVPTVLLQLQRLNGDHWVKPPTLGALFNVIRLLSLGPLYLVPPLALAALLPLLRARQRPAAAFLWMTSLVPMLVLWGLAMRGAGVFVERYMFFTLPAWCMLIAAGIVGLSPLPLRAGAALVVLASALRALLLREPQVEARHLTEIERWLSPRVAAGDVVVHADAHSLVFARHYALDAGRHVLLLATPRLPYYEGDLIIPREWRVDTAFVDSLALSGARWWAVSYRAGYAGSDVAAARLASAARDTTLALPRATVWRGGGAPDAAARPGSSR
jgi:Dolichyl-phosphate-mannose-protein mannosyltransferase